MKENYPINVRDFVFQNITPYDGDASFLVGPSEKTKKLWEKCKKLLKKETDNGGVLDIDTKTVSNIISHKPGYIEKELEMIVGLQTDEPLKRSIKPAGGIRTVIHACEENGKELDKGVVEIFTKYRKTHNDGVFDAYTEEMLRLRKTGILTGLPDAYARGRIIGDYRRVALYGVDKIIEVKKEDRKKLVGTMTDEMIRLREEVMEQIDALELMKKMADGYGFDIGRPALNAQEAIQWTYFGYLSAIKEHDGAAMSLGNVSSFFDIYIEKEIRDGTMTEEQAQELVDQFIIKLRLVRHLRTTEYNNLFAGDPTWITESLGGAWINGKHKVTKTTYRFLQTLYNLGPSPEPNLTILWSQKLPEFFKEFCTKVSIDTSSIQYENDDLMRTVAKTDDYGISCCVSLLETGKQMQFFGARCNIAKALLLAINEGIDEINNIKVIDGVKPLEGKYLNYGEVLKRFKKTMSFLAENYVNTMNVIHYMHDKYYYERAQMALLDTEVKRVMAFGLAGLSVAADSLSAIKFAKVQPIRNEQGITTDFEVNGNFPKYGNDEKVVDLMAKEIMDFFNKELQKHHIYRDAKPTLSILTITSNVVYGKKTGSTPDGRKLGMPFAPGANPMHGRDIGGAIASLNSVAKLDYRNARDGISNTFSTTTKTLGGTEAEQIRNLIHLLDGYFKKNGHHLNVNIMDRETLIKAMEHPELYPQLTIRVSGYAVNFIKLTREQQQEVLARTFFETM
ncbi:MAG: formate C-acetyltransferase [Candidatus Shapirobacteria bacterium]|jgi:formate C-acetyltransferase